MSEPSSPSPNEPGSGLTEPGSPVPPELVEIAHACFDFARQGETARLSAYVDRGVPVDLTDASGNTLLMLAAYHGRAGTVVALLERGADPDRLNDRGQSPLAGAIVKGRTRWSVP